MSVKPPKPEDWLETEDVKSRTGIKCSICSKAEAKAWVKSVLEVAAKKYQRPSWTSLARACNTYFDMNLNTDGNGVGRHVRNHEPETYERLTGRKSV